MAKKPGKAADVKLAEPGTARKEKPATQTAREKRTKQKATAPPVTEPARKKRGRPTKAEKAAEEQRIREAQKRRQLTTAEWRKIRTEYMKGKTTYAKLSEKYSISASVIRKRASSERWTDRKHKLDAKVEQKTVERVSDARARELARIAEIQEEVDDLLDATVKAIGTIKPEKFDDLRGLESLAKAVNMALMTKRDLYNLPNESERAKIESLREKARLDRQKYEDERAEKARLAAEAANTVIRIVYDGGEGGALDE